MRLSRNLQFWLFQLAGWGSWVLFLVLRDLTFVPAEYMFDRAVVFVMDAAVGMALTAALREFYKAIWDWRSWLRMLSVPLACLLASLVWLPAKRLIVSTDFGASVYLVGYGWSSMIDLLPITFILLLGWSLLYFGIKYVRLFQEQKEKFLRSEALAREAQLRMLHYQLNPHFLFNTLNAISTLIMLGASDNANRMITKLSSFLRYSLEHDPLEQVDLASELRSVQLYLDIEKVRFEERLQVEVEVSPEAMQALVPSMLLQPLVENSIKYAISRSEEGGCISIRAHVADQRLELEVADDGPGVAAERNDSDITQQPTSFGVGMSNIRNRLAELYGTDFRLISGAREPRGFCTQLSFPFRQR